jgi:hypothetical protein
MRGTRLAGVLAAAVSAQALLATGAVAQTGTVTYEQVLANPDDLRLNLTYAQQQSRSGNLERAAGTLERLLLIEPNWDSVRLFYARVLYRLDDMDGSRRELRILEARPLTPDQAQEVSRLLSQIDRKESPIHGSLALTIGGRVDSNADLAASSDDVMIGGVLVPSGADERIDGAFLAAARLRIEYQPSKLSDNILFLQLNGRLRDQIELDRDTFASAQAAGGAELYFGDLKLVPEGFYSPYFLGNDLVLEEVGARLRAEYDVSSRLTLLARGEFADQDFHSTSSNPIRDQRDGWRAEGGGGFRTKITNRNVLQLEASYERKEADVSHFSYEGPQLHLRDRQALGKGQYLTAEFWYWHFDYDDPDPAVDPTTAREDDRFKVRGAYGLPLSTAFSAINLDLPKEIGAIRFEVSGSYYNQDSNIPNFDTDNFSGDVTLTRNFNF